MPRQIIIDEQHRIAAVFAEEQIQELVVASGEHQVGDVYIGLVENVLPSIDAAFVNLGHSERNGFIHVSDLGPVRMKRGSAAITELVVPQQKVLVQVMKEPTGNKGPRLTGEISLPGRYLVLMPHGRGVNLSRRIQNDEERNRLKSLAILIKPSQMGLLVRTEAEGISDEAVIEDLEQLKKQWEQILQYQQQARQPGLINRDTDFIQRVLRDTYSSDVNRIVTDSPMGSKRVKQYLQGWNQGSMPPGVFVDAHREPTMILEYFRVNAAIRQALRPRVDLPSGGYIIIEPTEALTVVDVNSGSFTQSATARETVLWTNCEAATEIARQLKLRNIAGVIVVDFIDMESRRDQLQVLEHFNKALRSDKARPQVAQLSELGLVELTRKRQGQSLYELFGRPCPTCEGLGLLAHLPGSPEDKATPILEPTRPPVFIGGDEFTGDEATPGGRERNGRSQKPKPLRPSTAPRRGRFGAPRRDELEPFAPETETPAVASPAPSLDYSREKPSPRPTRSSDRRQEGSYENGSSERESYPRQRDTTRKVVTVTMDPFQQKVFSEMGLSPLLLLDEPVTMTRDTVISVVMPGGTVAEAEPEPTEVEPSSSFPSRPFPPPGVTDEFEEPMEEMDEVDPDESFAGEADVDDSETEDLLEESAPEVSSAREFPPSLGDDATTPRPNLFAKTLETPMTPNGMATEDLEDSKVERSVVPEQQSPAASRRKRSR